MTHSNKRYTGHFPGRGKALAWMLSAALLLSVFPAAAGAAETEGGKPFEAAKYFQIEAGGDRTAVVKNDGTLLMCGYNYHGEIGAEDYKKETAVKKLVKVTDDVMAVSCGGFHTLAVKNDGTLWAWGSNEYGQLGTGNKKDSAKPVQIKMPDNKNVIAISAGNYYSAAITGDGMLYTWGLNTNGRLGQNKASFMDCALTPSPILRNVMTVSLGDVNAAAVTNDGKVFVWGSNYAGQLGAAPDLSNILVPLQAAGISDAIDVSAGYSWTAALTEDHSLYTWGRNNRDALGTGRTDQYITTPQKILDHVIRMDTAYEHGAAITEDHTLYTWGNSSEGELGQGNVKRSAQPAAVRSDIRFATVSCSSSHCAAIDNSCNLWTWGWNGSGQLGYDGGKSSTPRNIMNLFAIVNTYKAAMETGHAERFIRTQTFQYVLSLFGGENGGISGKLREQYRKDGLHIVNGTWTLINKAKDATSFKFSTENSFDIVLSDLFNRSYGAKCFENIQFEELLSKLSDCITVYETAMDTESALQAQAALADFAKYDSLLEQGAAETLQKLLKTLDGVDLTELQNLEEYATIAKIGAPALTTTGDLLELTNKYTLYQSYEDISMKYASLLRETEACTEDLSDSTLSKSKASDALSSLSADITNAVDGDYTRLNRHAAGSIAGLIAQEGNLILEAAYKDTLKTMPYLAGTKLGLDLGVTVADKVTGMDDISKYGALMDSAGYLAQAMQQVAINRYALFEIDNSYNNVAGVKEAIELYYAIQMLSCDYAIGYCQAIVRDNEKETVLTADEKEAIRQMEREKVILSRARGAMMDFLDDTYSELVSYSVDCPVTVIVEDLQGHEIARQTTGEQTIDKNWEGYFHLLGEDLDCKAGVYNPKTQRLRIEGNSAGTMDVLFSGGSENAVSLYQRYEKLPVAKGCEYTFTDNTAVLDGKESFNPAVSYRQSFTDVPADAYYAAPVEWAVDKDITKGTSETTFSPDAGCTRGQAVTFLWRASGSEKVTGVSNPFEDIKENAYYYDAVLWAISLGITNGTSETTFSPDKGCSRGEIVTFLWRSLEKPKSSAPVEFTDVAPDAFYYFPVQWAVEKEVTNGTSSSTFSPAASCTRAQIVTFLYRALR